MAGMLRTVFARLDLSVAGPARIVCSVAVSADLPVQEEALQFTLDGRPQAPVEIRDDHGTRWHAVDAAVGDLVIDYRAAIAGLADPAPVTEQDRLRYLRPSRYCESDSLAPTALAEFGGLSGTDLLQAVVEWVHRHLTYVPGASRPTDGAVRTLLARQGVCRDFAHLAIALLRGLNVPARLAAVYAPGLSPMEFHAVAEAMVEDTWWVVDATGLAPRQSLARIATGRDAADTAFLTSFGAPVELTAVEVSAVVDDFGLDDNVLLTQLR